MKKSPRRNKLSLKTQTLRHLTSKRLQEIQGGCGFSAPFCASRLPAPEMPDGPINY